MPPRMPRAAGGQDAAGDPGEQCAWHPDQLDDSPVYIHSQVMVRWWIRTPIREFILVAESEADIKVGKISVSSPIGKGLLGKEKGDGRGGDPEREHHAPGDRIHRPLMPSIFTRIVNRGDPCHRVAEDDRYLAFLDINLLREGHTP